MDRDVVESLLPAFREDKISTGDSGKLKSGHLIYIVETKIRPLKTHKAQKNGAYFCAF